VRQFQQFADQLNRRIRANSYSKRRWNNEWNARLHVLGF